MSDFGTALSSRVSDADWKLMAAHAGKSPEELKAILSAGLEQHFLLKQKLQYAPAPTAKAAPSVSLAATTQSGDCNTQSFNITLFDVIGLSGTLTLCGTSTSDWSAQLKVCLVVLGAEVVCYQFAFDPHNLGVCWSPNVGIAKASICFNLEISSNKVCLNISGNACVWGFGWHCGDFNVTPFCLPLP